MGAHGSSHHGAELGRPLPLDDGAAIASGGSNGWVDAGSRPMPGDDGLPLGKRQVLRGRSLSPLDLTPHAPSIAALFPPPPTLRGVPEPGAEETDPYRVRGGVLSVATADAATAPASDVTNELERRLSGGATWARDGARRYDRYPNVLARGGGFATQGEEDACYDGRWHHVVQHGRAWTIKDYDEHAYRAWAEATLSPPFRRVEAPPPPTTTTTSLWHDLALSPNAARTLGRRLRGFGFFTDPRFQLADDNGYAANDGRYDTFRQARPTAVRGQTDHAELIAALTKIETIIGKNRALTLPEDPTPGDVEAGRAPYGMAGPAQRPNVHPAGFCVLCRFRPRPQRGESLAQWEGIGVREEREEVLLFRQRELSDTSGVQRVYAAAGWVWPESLRSHYLPHHRLNPGDHPGLGEFTVAMVAYARQLPDQATHAVYGDGRRVPIATY